MHCTVLTSCHILWSGRVYHVLYWWTDDNKKERPEDYLTAVEWPLSVGLEVQVESWYGILLSQDCGSTVSSCTCILSNLKFGTQFKDSDNAQHNLKVAQIPRLHRTSIPVLIYKAQNWNYYQSPKSTDRVLHQESLFLCLLLECQWLNWCLLSKSVGNHCGLTCTWQIITQATCHWSTWWPTDFCLRSYTLALCSLQAAFQPG